jgi:hypothetical protein
MATKLSFNNITTQVPGAYSSVDASGLATQSLGATGIVAIIGSAQGGLPYTAILTPADFTRLSSAGAASNAYVSGDLLEAANIAFSPSSDANISGAQQVVALKVNPSTQSSAVFANSHGPVMKVTSLDSGAMTGQINISIAPGSAYGQMLTIGYQDLIETADNLGGNINFAMQYVTGGADTAQKSWTQMSAGVDLDGSIHANGVLTQAGLATDVTSSNGTPTAAQVTWTTADAGQTLVVYGLDASGNALRESIVLGVNGGTQATTNLFAIISGSVLSSGDAMASITVALRGNQALTFSPGQRARGAVSFTDVFVANAAVAIHNPGSAAITVVVDGLDAQGAPQAVAVNVPGNGTVATPVSFTLLTAIAAGAVAAGTNIGVAGQAARFSSANSATLQQAANYFNSLSTTDDNDDGRVYGFVVQSDYTTAKVQLSSLDATSQDFSILTLSSLSSGLNALVNWINNNSLLVSATTIAGAAGAPSNTVRPVYLGGGGEGQATFADYQKCLNLLKNVFVNSVVCLTSDPAVSAAVDAHCAYMNGRGKKERDGFVGLMNTGLTDVPNIDQALAQTQSLNSRNIRAFPQAISRYDSTGTLREFAPHFTAVLAAGMQAGATIGTSLTHKYASLVSFRSDASLDPTDNAEVLIGGGLMYLEHVDGVGSRWVRNITTYLQSDNLAYTEGSVNAAANYAVYSLRTGLEAVVGLPNFAGTATAASAIAVGILQGLVKSGILTGYDGLDLEIVGDTLAISVAVSPIIPDNFVTLTMHLATQSTTNAAASAA